VLWALGAATAVMTAFYMTRVFYLTFLGKERFDAHDPHDNVVSHSAHAKTKHGHGHPGEDPVSHEPPESDDHHGGSGVHESPAVMMLPLWVLAILSALGGFIGIPHLSWLDRWLAPVIPAHHETAAAASLEWILMAVSVAGAAFGIWFAFSTYKDMARAEARKQRWAWLHKTLENKWYVDEIFNAIFVRPIHMLSQGLWKGFDVAVIDRIVLGFGRVSNWTGQAVRVLQTGSIQIYAFMILVGLVATVGYLIYGMA
jgi:NADH-quinone oxidoreductase subunit L